MKEEVKEGVAKSVSAEEVTTAERRGTRASEKSGEKEVTTVERRGKLKNEKCGEEDVTTEERRGTPASDARTQATRGNWIRRATSVFASIVCCARRLATGVSSDSA